MNKKDLLNKIEEINTKVNNSEFNEIIGSTDLLTIDKTIKGSINELFTSASNGKTIIETAITGKGGTVSKSNTVATYNELKNGIESIETLEFNIFSQTTEPATKYGLWINCNNKIDNISSYDDIGFDSFSSSTTNVGYNTFKSKTSCYSVDNRYIYFFGGESYTYATSRYDIILGTSTSMASMPSSYRHYAGGISGYDTNIYLFGSNESSYSKKAVCYNTLTNTFTTLTDIPYSFNGGKCSIYGTDIHLFGKWGGATHYKYSILTSTYTQLKDVPYSFFGNTGIKCITINDCIYLIGGATSLTSLYAYYPLIDTYEKLTDLPYSFDYGTATKLGNFIFLFFASKYVYRYDTINKTYLDLSSLNKATETTYVEGFNIGYTSYVFGNQSINKFIFKEASNTLYLNNKKNTYKIKILNSKFDILNYLNIDNVIETDSSGNILSCDTYIGDGTKWDLI